MGPTNRVMKTIEELKRGVQQRLTVNGARKGTQKAGLIEHEFLQGVNSCSVSPQESILPPAVIVCMMSGRSILKL